VDQLSSANSDIDVVKKSCPQLEKRPRGPASPFHYCNVDMVDQIGNCILLGWFAKLRTHGNWKVRVGNAASHKDLKSKLLSA
jgi:hypothetical protein